MSRPPHLPQVTCYHAEIHVQDGDQIKTLLVDCPDWSPDVEILGNLAMKYKAETVGDIVAAMEGEGKVRIESVSANDYCRGDRKVYPVEKPIRSRGG
jgi:hypothetical protein